MKKLIRGLFVCAVACAVAGSSIPVYAGAWTKTTVVGKMQSLKKEIQSLEDKEILKKSEIRKLKKKKALLKEFAGTLKDRPYLNMEDFEEDWEEADYDYDEEAEDEDDDEDEVTLSVDDEVDLSDYVEWMISGKYASVRWSVDDSEIAEISKGGVLTPLAEGTVTVTLKSSISGKGSTQEFVIENDEEDEEEDEMGYWECRYPPGDDWEVTPVPEPAPEPEPVPEDGIGYWECRYPPVDDWQEVTPVQEPTPEQDPAPAPEQDPAPAPELAQEQDPAPAPEPAPES